MPLVDIINSESDTDKLVFSFHHSWNHYCVAKATCYKNKCLLTLYNSVPYRNVRGTILESEGKVDDIDYSVYFKGATVFWIYISSNIGVLSLYLLDPLSIQLAQCPL